MSNYFKILTKQCLTMCEMNIFYLNVVNCNTYNYNGSVSKVPTARMNVNHLGMMKCKMTAVTQMMYADGSTDGWPLGLSRHLPEKKNNR